MWSCFNSAGLSTPVMSWLLWLNGLNNLKPSFHPVSHTNTFSCISSHCVMGMEASSVCHRVWEVFRHSGTVRKFVRFYIIALENPPDGQWGDEEMAGMRMRLEPRGREWGNYKWTEPERVRRNGWMEEEPRPPAASLSCRYLQLVWLHCGWNCWWEN